MFLANVLESLGLSPAQMYFVSFHLLKQMKAGYEQPRSRLNAAANSALFGLGIGALTGNAGRGAAIGAITGAAFPGIAPKFFGGKKRKTKSRKMKKSRKTPKRTRKYSR